VGLKRLKSDTYSSSVIFHWATGPILDPEASTLATEYGAQWMNMPNFASRYQVVLSASDSAVAAIPHQARSDESAPA